VSRRKPEIDEIAPADEPFLQRWSRLKSVARDSPDPPDAGPPAPPAAAEPVEQTADGQEVAPALPDLALLGPDSDYSAFLSPKVDAALRRTALRKLFHSPKFNVTDGLDDYCDDFTQFAPLGDIVTVDMRHQIERAARELAERAARTLPGGQPLAAETPQSTSPAESATPDPVEPTAATEEENARQGPA